MNGAPAANELGLPTVTVFGAGIAGLTAAHELVERGFPVQVVELEEDDFSEYECAVGGLAANQFTRVRAPLSDLHDPWLTDDKELLNQAEQFRWRERRPQRTSKRFPILQTIRFDRTIHDPSRPPGQPRDPPDFDRVLKTPYEPQGDIPADWRDYWDNHGVTNGQKLGAVLKLIRDAALHYMALYFPPLFDRLALGSEPGDDDWRFYSSVHPTAEYAKKFVAREVLVVKIIGYTDTDGSAEDSRALADAWAKDVKRELIRLNRQGPADLGVWRLEDHLDVVVVGSANPRYDQSDPIRRSQSNRVEFEVVEQVIPGEHGFRFFPAFYRHLFDTMRRTPVLDSKGRADGQTAFDQLVPTPQAFLALNRDGLRNINVRRFSSLFELNETLRLFSDRIGFTPRDLLGLQYFTLRYLMSCPERREASAEPISLLEYFEGTDPEKKLFSPAARKFIEHAPRALAAMSASESDARTQADITIQLTVAPPADNVVADMTLNGPTSAAWLDHWKTYLKIQGVKFFVGKLNSLRLANNHFIPDVSGPKGWPYPHPCPENAYDTFDCPREDGVGLGNYRFVLATSFQKASDVIWAASALRGDFVGPFQQLINFDIKSERRLPGQLAAPEPARDPSTGKEIPKTYPLRTISGLQYFFPQQYRFGAGNVYFASAPWALTSISQFAYWRQRVRPVGPFLGQISVDVGDWHAFYPSTDQAAAGHGNTAWYSSSQEVADKTWAQVKDGLAEAYAAVIHPPTYFHIDRNIVFEETGRSGLMGSALLHISQSAKGVRRFARYALKFAVTDDKWSGFGGESARIELPFHSDWVRGDEVALTPDMLASTINRELGRHILAQPFRTGERIGVLVSPKALRARFVIAFRPPSTEEARERDAARNQSGAGSAGRRSARKGRRRPGEEAFPSDAGGSLTESNFCIAIDDEPPRLVSFDEYHADPAAVLHQILEKFSDVIEFNALHEVHSTFEIKRRDDQPFRVGVGNINSAVEILDGPQLEVVIGSNLIQIVNTMYAPSGRTAAAAVRANATVGIPTVRQDDTPNGLQAGRTYGIGLGVGTESVTKVIRHAVAESDSDPASAREVS